MTGDIEYLKITRIESEKMDIELISSSLTVIILVAVQVQLKHITIERVHSFYSGVLHKV